MNYISFKTEEMLRPPFKNVITESVDIILESMHSFSEQYKESERISKMFLEMIKNDEMTKNCQIIIDNETISLVLYLKKSKDLVKKSYAETGPHGYRDNNGNIVLTELQVTLYISQFDLLSLDEDALFKKINQIISHEIMHGNIFSKRISNRQDINLVDWYIGIHDILQNEKNSLIREFAYSMYACYYQERQAIVSSTYTQLLEFFNKNRLNFIKNKISKLSEDEKYEYLLKIYKNDLLKTEAYQTYITIKQLCNTITENDKYLIKNLFKKYRLNINIEKEINRCTITSNQAIKDVNRNGSLFFYEYLLPEIKKS